MITDVHLDAAPARLAGPAEPSSVKDPRGVRRRQPGTTLAVWLLCAGLVGFNAWWYWRDTRAVADLATINAWMGKEEYAHAEPALRELLRRAPHDGGLRTMLAKVLAARGDLAGCTAELHRVPSWWPTKAESLFREGQAYLMMDRAKDAETTWLAVTKDDPLHPGPPEIVHDASLELIKLYAAEDRWEDVNVVLWGAYENASPADHMALLYMRVRSELERIAPEETIGRLERYVAADPTDWQALRALAKAELALGRRADADRHFRACLEGDPENARAWCDYLGMLHSSGDMDAWAALLARVPPAAEAEAEVWRFRGLLKERSGDWAGAAEDYRKALERNPFSTAYHYRLAMAEERQGHRDVAAEHRKRSDQLREARAQLLPAFTEVIETQEGRNPQGPGLSASIKRLASVCEALGFSRLSEAWNKLAEAS
jgi:thioredoxin-like negative regulator of GroEL